MRIQQARGFLNVGRTKFMNQSKLTILLEIILAIFLIFYSKTLLHVTKEFFIHKNFNIKLCRRFHQHEEAFAEKAPSEIPKIIHQVFFNLSDNRIEFMKKFKPYQQTWIEKNPDHQYILWNATMIDELINKSYPHVAPIYNRYRAHWVVRADIARYLVVHHMGGVYADLDVLCKRSMNDLYSKIGDKSVVLNYTYNPIGISNDFFIAAKNSEFMEHVIDGLEQADLIYLTPYVNTMFRTGPMFMLGRYLNYPHKDEHIYLIPQSSIYIDSSTHGRSWYEFDGQVIAIFWDGVSPVQILSIILLIYFIVRLNKLIKVRRTLLRQTKRQVRYRHQYKIPEHEAL